jgi:replication factor C subunit 2/4
MVTEDGKDGLSWVEKYRPKKVADLAGQSGITEALESIVKNCPDQLPHLLFYGPPGNGKTSLTLALAQDLFGPELYKARILELNASDERGIAVIREKVKTFARSLAKETVPGYPCPQFKLCILDEADALTNDAQTALRRVIEANSKSTR